MIPQLRTGNLDFSNARRCEAQINTERIAGNRNKLQGDNIFETEKKSFLVDYAFDDGANSETTILNCSSSNHNNNHNLRKEIITEDDNECCRNIREGMRK